MSHNPSRPPATAPGHLYPGQDPMHPSSDDYREASHRPTNARANGASYGQHSGLPPLPSGLPPLPTIAASAQATNRTPTHSNYFPSTGPAPSSSVSLWSQLSSPSVVIPETPAKILPSSSFRPVKRSASAAADSPQPIGHVLVATPVYSSTHAGYHSPAPVLVDSPSPAHAVPTTKKRRLVRRADIDAAAAAAATAATANQTASMSPPNTSSTNHSDDNDMTLTRSTSTTLIHRILANTGHDLDRARAQLRRLVTAQTVAGASAIAAQRKSRTEEHDDDAEYMPSSSSSSSRRLKPKSAFASIDQPLDSGRRPVSPLVPKPKHKSGSSKRTLHLSDSDDFDASGDDDSDASDASDGADQDDPQTTHFFNTASLVELAEYLQCTPDQAHIVSTLRPFKSQDDIAAKLTAAKSVSARMLEKYHEVNQALAAVEDVIQECEKIGDDLANAMREWPDTSTTWLTSELSLKAYQIVGVSWLALLHGKGLSGILADDMGLGKTAQVIATLDNWMREFGRWVSEERMAGGDIRVEAYVGSQAERLDLGYELLESRNASNDSNGNGAEGAPVTVVVTTYNFATSKDDKKFLARMKFAGMIVDEGHSLKNADSLRYKSLMAIKSAKFRLLLTGTPLQNNLQELLSLLTFILPDVFAHVASEWRTLLKLKSIDTISAQRLLRVKKVMAPFILRRKKINVLADLPPKSVRIDLAHSRRPSKPCRHSSVLFRRHYTDDQCAQIARALMREEQYEKEKLEHVIEDLTFMSDFEIHALCSRFKRLQPKFALRNDEWMDSGKVERLREVLDECKAKGDRCLLFSQFTMALDVLEEVLVTLGHKYLRIDGSTVVSERQPLIDKFYDDKDILVFLLSTKAGGQGLNLAAANVVILHDLDFNPHNDSQAEDRAWRLGQTKPVQVIKLVCKGTIEEVICERQQIKLNLDKKLTNVGMDTAGDATPQPRADGDNDDEDETGPRKTDAAYEQEMMRLIATQLVKDVTDPAAAAQVDDGDMLSMSGLGSEASSMRGDTASEMDGADTSSVVSGMSGW
ncbi:P-loop containing nucleoside triphosphate hydrolase protein [Catenaria anguillulae PL171]|uniref:p-loop containing nucleoside triphosphate hydrolase protein n=1 Tax=Catenaria anguillulae PL171 TaxID=765915 RepID=A0A1Y2I6K4_9FUNG|nr:P-loop containing nucleoside triphosphate hydrolase protein [Catenaria anguillulae PL171]